MTQRKIRLLTFSTLYPSSVRPGHGIFVETRLRELLLTGEVEVKVVSPVPWFFSQDPKYGDYALMAKTPKAEIHNGIEVQHPRYILPPKVGMNIAPFLMAIGAAKTIRRLLDDGYDFDLIDAHYYYPDGVAAALLAKWFGKPYVVTARGTDLNLIPQFLLPRRMIHWAAHNAQASIGVCSALVDVLRDWGLDPNRLHVMRNGVDLVKFSPLPQAEARDTLSWHKDTQTLLSVGYLIERKGHQIAIQALKHLPKWHLKIIGSGPDQGKLEKLASDIGAADRVTFIGQIQQNELRTYYSAADILVLASSREGWANVLLESMACGTPVVATNIWGTPEVVASKYAGRLMERRDADCLVKCVKELMSELPDCVAVRTYAEQFSWDETTARQLALFRQIVGKSH